MADVLTVIGTGGMGEAIARRSGAGHRVLLADFSEEALESLAGRLRGDGFAVTTQSVDVADRASLESLAERAASLGRVTKVAHTAGLSPTQAGASAILRVDLAGVAHSLDAFGAVVAEGGAGVVIASMAGTMAAGQIPSELTVSLATTPSDQLLDMPFLSGPAVEHPGIAYAISKRANQIRVQAMSIPWAKRGARINCISPGVISTPMGQAELQSESGATMREMISGSGSGRIGTAADIANAAAFLLGPDASFITGANLLVDGGVVAAVQSGQLVIPVPDH